MKSLVLAKWAWLPPAWFVWFWQLKNAEMAKTVAMILFMFVDVFRRQSSQVSAVSVWINITKIENHSFQDIQAERYVQWPRGRRKVQNL
jgi:hypothetical protein